MDIISSNCIPRNKRNEININLEGKDYIIRYKDITKENVYPLNLYHKERIRQISIRQNIPEKQVLYFLVDYYYLDNSRLVNVLIKQLLNRLFLGVDKGFIIQVRMLYTTLGHFLKKLRYI